MTKAKESKEFCLYHSRQCWGQLLANQIIYCRNQSPADSEDGMTAERQACNHAPLSFLHSMYISVSLSLPQPPSLYCARHSSIFKMAQKKKNQQPQEERKNRIEMLHSNATRSSNTLKEQERNRPKSLQTRRVQLGPSALSLSLCYPWWWLKSPRPPACSLAPPPPDHNTLLPSGPCQTNINAV